MGRRVGTGVGEGGGGGVGLVNWITGGLGSGSSAGEYGGGGLSGSGTYAAASSDLNRQERSTSGFIGMTMSLAETQMPGIDALGFVGSACGQGWESQSITPMSVGSETSNVTCSLSRIRKP